MYDFTDVFCRALSAMLPPPCQVLEMRGDSFQHFGNAAIVQSIVDKLPDIAKEIAAPLSKTEKVRPGAPPPSPPQSAVPRRDYFGALLSAQLPKRARICNR